MNNRKIGDLTLRQFILDEVPDDRLGRIQSADETTQEMLFSSVFGAFTHGIKEMGLKFIFPVGTLFTLVAEAIKLYRFVKFNNKSANSILGTIVGVGGAVLEVAAVTIMVAALFATVLWLAPLLFLINVGAKFLYSLASTTYYAIKCLLNWSRGERGLQQHQSDWNHLKASLKGLILSSTFLGIVLVMFFIPAAFPAVGIGAAIVYGFQIAASTIFGAFGLWGVYSGVKKFFEKPKTGNPIDTMVLSDAVESVYRQKFASLNIRDDKENKILKLLDYHVDDLLIYMKKLVPFEAQDSYEKNAKKDFLLKLITAEEKHLNAQNGQFKDKKDALQMLRNILEITTNFQVPDLILHYQNSGQLKNIFRSRLNANSRMQKLFYLVSEYEVEASSLKVAYESPEMIIPSPSSSTVAVPATPHVSSPSPFMSSLTAEGEPFDATTPSHSSEIITQETVKAEAPLIEATMAKSLDGPLPAPPEILQDRAPDAPVEPQKTSNLSEVSLNQTVAFFYHEKISIKPTLSVTAQSTYFIKHPAAPAA